MTNRKSTRHALFMSAMSILLCIAMLIGSTFAWFTDTAETEVNKIQSGTLDIELQAAIGENGKFVDATKAPLEFKKAADAPTDEAVLWEPGATYVLPELKIVNNGNLAVKYKVIVNGVSKTSDAKLLEAIDFTVTKDGNATPASLSAWEGIILPAGIENTTEDVGESKAFTISGTMKTDASNAYQNLTLDGIGITVVATQYTYEYDSTENTYDKDATYPAVLTVAKDVSTSTKTENGKTVIDTSANGGNGVTVEAKAETTTGTTTAPTVTATIPDGVQLDDGATAVALSVVETETNETIKAQIVDADGNTVDTKTLEVKLTGVSTDNTTPIIVTYQNDNLKGLVIKELYHNTEKMTEDSNLDTANDYTFNSETGTLQMALTSFSPFTLVYEKPVEPTYPADVTKASFTDETTAAYVDAQGDVQYVADVTDAIQAGATTVYVKEDATVKLNDPKVTNRTSDLTKDLTIYANGADFQHGEVSMNMTEGGKAANITLKIYDAKNIYVWGGTPNNGVTQNVILENCHNEGTSATYTGSRLFYITGTTGTVNATLRNCSVTKAEAPVYMNCNGSVTVENCSFSECASAMKLSLKATSGTTKVTVSDTTFDKCGWTTEVSGQSYLTEDSSSIKIKTKSADGATLTLNNVAITNVVGDNSIVVDGESSYTGTTTVNATNVTVNGEAWSNTSTTTDVQPEASTSIKEEA